MKTIFLNRKNIIRRYNTLINNLFNLKNKKTDSIYLLFFMNFGNIY